jgi:protein phosphatase
LANLTTFARTDVGLVRTNNEDSVFADTASGLLIVADGMGGHAAGEVASQMAIDTVSKTILSASNLWPFGRAQRERGVVLDAIRAANQRIREAAAENGALKGMGTTVVVLWVRGSRAHVAHVGDSRIYRLRQGRLDQLTHDHSWPSEDGAMRNVLTRAVGAEAEIEVDHSMFEVEPGDVFLLCSDGLTRTVDDPTIVEILGAVSSGEEALGRLIELAKQKGAPDNVTVALAYC